MFVEYEAKVTNRVSGVKRIVMYFSKLRGMPQRESCGEDRLREQRTRKERDDKYDLNQFKTVP